MTRQTTQIVQGRRLQRCISARLTGVVALLIVLGSGCKTDKAKREERLAKKRRRALSSLPYLAWRPASKASLKKVGVVLHDRKRAHEGYNLYCPYHGDQVRLINMKGELVHSWSLVSATTRRPEPVCLYPELASDGSLYVLRATKAPLPMVKLDWRSKVLWVTDLAVHHDVAISRSRPGTDTVHVLGWEAVSVRRRGQTFRFDGDTLVRLSAEGKAAHKRSLYRILSTMPGMRSRMERSVDLFLARTLLTSVYEKSGLTSAQIEQRTNRWVRSGLGSRPIGEKLEELLRKHAVDLATLARRHEEIGSADLRDLLHTNTLEILDAHPKGLWKAGDLLVCMKTLDAIAVIDGTRSRVLWAWGFEELQGPHHPSQSRRGPDGVRQRDSLCTLAAA
jgi:hypothetical protein